MIAAIHWEALRLWLKGLRLHTNPGAPLAPVTIVKSEDSCDDSQTPFEHYPPSRANGTVCKFAIAGTETERMAAQPASTVDLPGW